MSTLLERPPVARSVPVSQPPHIYGWRFPAEFRTKPVGWTERKQLAPATRPKDAGTAAGESSVGSDMVRDVPLDRGPEGLACSYVRLQEQDASNVSLAPLPVLAFDATAAPAMVEIGIASVEPQMLEVGPPAGLQAVPPLHEIQSNAGATLRLRDLGAAPVVPRQEAAAATDLLAIGDPAAWVLPPRNALPGCNEASYAVC